jgi:hypothetical protein
MSWRHVTTLDRPFQNYRVEIEGEERSDGTWGGRVAFVSAEGRRTTAQETSQPNREAVEYWGTGLERIYLEGALSRARDTRHA